MKKHILYLSVTLASAAMITGCSENAWNDHLDGFESGFKYTEKITVDYTLSNTDYETIGKALANVATSDEETQAAKAIQSNHYFDQSSPYTAQIAIPYLLNQTSSDYYIYSDGSVAEITFYQASATPAELGILAAAPSYTLNSANYQEVWGSESDFVNSFSPERPAANYLPGILASQYPDAEEGDYAVVTYNEATQNPIYGSIGGEEGEVELTDAIKNLSVGSNLNATAVVTGQCSRGLILTDNGGSILYYNQDVDLTAYPIGTVVKVSGEVSAYNLGLQLSASASIQTAGSISYTYPAPAAYSPSMVDTACEATEDFQATYVSIDGQLSVSGNYYNVIIDGASAQGSIYYATDELKAQMEDGESYTFYGYFVAVSGSSTKYFNILVTAVGPIGGDAPGSVSLSDAIKGLSVGSSLNATAVVTGQCARGLILTDNAGSILYYNQDVVLSNYPIGTVVKVSGEVSAYNLGLQLSNSATLEVVGNMAYAYPAATEYTAAQVDAACEATSDMLATYVALNGQLNVSGNYYNIIIDGASAQGSVYYATDEVKAKMEDGASYTFYGYFIAVSGSSTKYFNILVTDVEPATKGFGTRSVAFAPTSETVNAVYYYNGSKWAPAEEVAVLSPSDYEEMGSAVNSLTDADIYIPLYLKKEYPYALSGDQMFVVYNIKDESNSSALFVYDGSEWTMNDNGLEEVTAAFTKTNGTWSFTKYLGKAIFDLFTEEEIELDRSYMLVSGAVCANPVLASNSYGYLLTTSVSISGNQIVMANETNAFAFLSSFEVDGKTVNVPEGYFVIKDSNERFMYLQGTYSSFNVRAEAPELNEDGSIVEGYLFSATVQEDGTWMITNNRGEGNIRNIYYSTKYNNFAGYTDQSADDSLPFLYILEAE